MVIAEREEIANEAVATKATVIVCAWRGLVVETAECLLQLRDRGWGYAIKRGDALITRSRAIAVSGWYRQTDEDVFLMVDDDVVFLPEHAERVVELARKTRSIACAAYPVKDGTHLACRRFPGQEIRFGRDSEPVEIVYPATGFMAVHRDVIDAMVEAPGPYNGKLYPRCEVGGDFWPFFDTLLFQDDAGRYEDLSEDYAFGERARRLGFKVWLDPSVILYHMGQYPYTIENMKNVKNLEVEDAPVKTVDGFSMFLPEGDQVITQDVKLQGFWDEETRDAIKAHLKPGWTFLDLGAHVGYFSLLAASMGNPVIAFEPMPDLAAMFRRNVELNGFKGVNFYEAALVEADLPYKSAMMPNEINTGGAYRVMAGTEGSIPVADMSLRSVINNGWHWPEFVKVDIEGDEYRVLKDCHEVLEHAQVIICEVSESQLLRNSGVGEASLLTMLEKAGFRMQRLHGRSGYADWLGIKGEPHGY